MERARERLQRLKVAAAAASGVLSFGGLTAGLAIQGIGSQAGGVGQQHHSRHHRRKVSTSVSTAAPPPPTATASATLRPPAPRPPHQSSRPSPDPGGEPGRPGGG